MSVHSPVQGYSFAPTPQIIVQQVQSTLVYILNLLNFIGASVSEPHTSESNWDLDFPYIIINIQERKIIKNERRCRNGVLKSTQTRKDKSDGKYTKLFHKGV